MDNLLIPRTPEIYLADIRNQDFTKKNYDNYKILIDICNNYRIVSFLGAGTSQPQGIKDWDELIILLQEYVKKNFNKEIIINKNDLPLTAEYLFKEFESQKKEKVFDDIVFQNMEPNNNSTNLTLIKLVRYSNTHFTTNFDISINSAYDFNKKNNIESKKLNIYAIPCLPSYHQINKEINVNIVYLHGKKDGPYIFRLRDYEKFYPSNESCNQYSRCIEDCLKTFLKEVSFIFIGFSFKDKRLKEMIFEIISEIKRDMLINEDFLGVETRENSRNIPAHFLLTQNDEDIYGDRSWDKFYQEYEQYGIYPVIYQKGKHIFIEHLLDYLIGREQK